MRSLVVVFACLPVLLSASCRDQRGSQPQTVRVWAAASLTDVVGDLCEELKKQGRGVCEPNFAATSLLARQIESGGPADVFLAADVQWVSGLEAKGLVSTPHGTDWLGNELVAIVPVASTTALAGPEDLTSPRIQRIALADPAHVPAGVYARKTFENMGLWASLESKIVGATDVRSALAMVESGSVDAGVVYRTDALASDRARVAFRFPADKTPRIQYSACLTAAGAQSPAATAFLDFVYSREAIPILEKRGFDVPWE
jgi:molybdate transport system substrate-binding protein